jgi:hypothetical protein
MQARGEILVTRPYRIADDIQLPLGTAVWVLAAHLYAILVPVVLIIAIIHHWAVLSELLAYPELLLVACGVMMAGSAFEVGQNAIDRWYLTRETGSAEGTGFCDFMFFWFIVISQGLIAVACMGDQWWVVAIAVVVVLVHPLLYIRQQAAFAGLGVLGLLATGTAWFTLQDPVIFLQLLLSPLTMYFFGLLLKTGNQTLHGFTTLAASSGVLFLAWGVHGGAAGEPRSWTFVVATAFVTIVLAAVLRPALSQLSATPRPRALQRS